MKHPLFLICFVLCLGLFEKASSQKAKAEDIGDNAGTFWQADAYSGFIPVPPLSYRGRLIYYDSTKRDFMALEAYKIPTAFLNPVLSDLSVESYLSKNDLAGNVQFAPVSVAAEKGSYQVNYDIAKFTTVLLSKEDDACKVYAKVGVGIRIRADIQTKKKNLNVSNLAGLGVSASQDKLQGGISFQIFGMESKDITNLSPQSLAIDTNAIGLALQSGATIKTKIHDRTTTLSPHIFAIKKEGCKSEDASKQVYHALQQNTESWTK